MLLELTITDFAIIDTLHLRFGPHLNVFTGETGAGKSIIIDAISALVGERMGGDVVRAGSERALVEGVFDIGHLLAREKAAISPPAKLAVASESEGGAPEAETLTETLAEFGIEVEDGTLILSREIARTGRGIQRANGRATPLSALQRIATFLIDIHGQSAHLTILRPEQHVYYLDRYAATDDLRQQVAALVGEWRATRRELDRLQRDERELERQRELLQYQVDEIEAAKLRPGELEELERERKMLANAEQLGALCVAIHSALAGDETGEASGALDTLAAAQRDFADLLRLDDSLREQLSELEQALYLVEDVATSVRAYQEEVAADPQRQAEVEERLDLLAKLRRKYGATIEDVLVFGEDASRTLDTLSHREERIAELQQREEAIRQRIGGIASDLSQRRQSAGRALGTAMERELDDLNMQRTRFLTEITQRGDEQGAPATLDGQTASWAFTATGIDSVEFLLAPNPGEPLKPLARIASGGETSRIMLALKTILSRADAVPILIFDEIDAGISGRSGQVVGEKLWALGQSHQVLCVTHLPQIAVLADTHFRVSKALSADRTTTQVEELKPAERTRDVAQMLGGARTSASQANAADLIKRADTWKRSHKPRSATA
ncbi:MAG TPA: DNA repair protein RecN [Ktedonobacterales bacterium]|nr:DNA repair protein RecN [Ktedonobacterales bacterium]